MNEQATPTKKKKKKRRKWSPLFCIIYFLIFVVMIVCIGLFVKQLADFHQSDVEFEKAVELVQIPDMSDLLDMTIVDDDTPADTGDAPAQHTIKREDLYELILDRLGLAHIEALQVVNPDVIGWIYITGTDISYPILQGENNDVYIRASWMDRNVYLTAGVIFMESLNHPDFSDFNTILYGHRMHTLTMFGKLKFYNSKDYWKQHPNVYIVTPERIIRYDIYSAYEVPINGKTYQLGFGGAESKQEYINYTLEMSDYDTGIVPTPDDHILTLSTCSGIADYSTRWIVQGVQAQEILRNPDATVETSADTNAEP